MIRVLELFSGIGGCAEAIGDRGEVVLAVDQNPYAERVYTHNFSHPVRRWNLVGVKARQLRDLGAHLWWMSPPWSWGQFFAFSAGAAGLSLMGSSLLSLQLIVQVAQR